MKIFNRVAKFIGRLDYKFDDKISKTDFIELIFLKSVDFCRFNLKRLLFRRSNPIGFLGKKNTLKFSRNISFGKGINIGDFVTINALSSNGVLVGQNVTIKSGTTIDCTGVFSEIGDCIEIGDNVGISENCFIQVRGKVILENEVILGPSVKIFSENHNFQYKDQSIVKQGTNRKGVLIKEGAWVGSNAVILDGVTVGQNAVIAAGSIVNKDVEAFAVVGGNPAKLIKKR